MSSRNIGAVALVILLGLVVGMLGLVEADLYAVGVLILFLGSHRCRHRATSWSRVPDLDHTRKGGNVVTIPLAPRTARTIDPASGKRCHGPILQAADGRRLDRHGAGRIVRWVARPAGISKAVTPHTRHAFISAGLDAGVPLRDAQGAASDADPRTTMRYYNRAVGQRGPACAGLVPHALGCP